MKHTNSLQSYNERLFKVNSIDYVIITAAVVAFVIFAGVVSSTANAQNSSSINSNGFPTNGTAKNATTNGTAKNATTNQTNKTVIVAGPGTSTTVVKAGNKTIISTTPNSITSKSSLTNTNRTGFANLYVLTSPTGKTFPIKYTIKGGKLVGMLADKDRTTLVLVLDPGRNGGNMTVELPRNIIDSKGASNSDTKYQVKMDGKGVDYKEVANNMNARILSIDFSKDNRFVEFIGTQMTP
ncbi:MAG: hypothetical protein WBZ36_25280 [Candidatus Nitrosopolaris sp.]